MNEDPGEAHRDERRDQDEQDGQDALTDEWQDLAPWSLIEVRH